MTDKCIFCEIASGRIPSIRVHEDSDFLAFMDINPVSPGHLLLVTREHFASTLDVPDKILARALPLAKRIAEAAMTSVGVTSFNLLVNNGPESGQLVPHWHLHVIPRKDKSEFPMKTGEPADLTKLPFAAASIRENLNVS
jgi:histidine triad (HIT) family protein